MTKFNTFGVNSWLTQLPTYFNFFIAIFGASLFQMTQGAYEVEIRLQTTFDPLIQLIEPTLIHH